MTGGQCPSYATPEDMATLREHFQARPQIVEIGAVIALFGFNNRWNALMETDIEDSVVSFTGANNYHGPKDFKTQLAAQPKNCSSV
jgi:hypothetical protein